MANDLSEDIGNLPLVLGPAGLMPQSPADLRAQLIALVSKTNPDYTANLPGSLVEDIASTDVAALILIDRMRVEMLNSLTPRGCNAFVLNQLGQIYGVQVGQSTNTSVYVRFTGLPGFVVGKGFTVTDGNFQYALSDGGVCGSDGNTPPLFALATQPGIWAVPAGTVTGIISSVPSGFTLSVVNDEPGFPGTDVETITSYRSRVLMAGLAASQGMGRYLRTLLGNVPGVQPRLIGIQQQPNGQWSIIVGGGDPYQVAYAIYTALFDINNLVGSTLGVVTISQANPGLVTLNLNHLYMPGQPVTIAGVTPPTYNGSFAVIDTPTQQSFHIGTPYSNNAIQSLVWAATAAPGANGALSQTAGGALAARTLYVRSTWVTPLGETTAAPETSLAVLANNLLNVAAPASPPSGVTGWNVYVSNATGTETKQNTTPIALGATWVQPVSGIITTGSALPSSSTAGGVATAVTLAPHGVTVGSTFAISGATPAGWNSTALVATAGTAGTTLNWALAASPGAATVNGQLVAGVALFNTSGLAAYVSGGVVTPNLRNNIVTLSDYPDTYQIPFIIPPQQTIASTVQWHTTSPNFVSAAAVAQLAIPALVDYINSIPVGQPINLYAMQDVFTDAVEPVLPASLISTIIISISINGVGTPVTPGTGLFNGDPQSYFFATSSNFNIVQI
jgi:hypothetical protein